MNSADHLASGRSDAADRADSPEKSRGLGRTIGALVIAAALIALALFLRRAPATSATDTSNGPAATPAAAMQ